MDDQDRNGPSNDDVQEAVRQLQAELTANAPALAQALDDAWCPGTECITQWRDDIGNLTPAIIAELGVTPQARYVACATCGADVTEDDDPYAEKVGRSPRPHLEGLR